MMAGSSARAPTEMGYEDQCKSGSIVNLEFQKYNQLKTLDQKSDRSFEFPDNEGVVNVTQNNSPIKVIQNDEGPLNIQEDEDNASSNIES